jgi:hypothetical protein
MQLASKEGSFRSVGPGGEALGTHESGDVSDRRVEGE